MKRIILILSFCFAIPVMAGQDSGGGTSLAAEFVYVGRMALNVLTKELPKLDLSKADLILKNTEVYDVGSICYLDPTTGVFHCRDAEYSAIEQQIKFDRNKWAQKTCVEKFVITSHEYLRAGGLEDANYFYSSLFYGTNLSAESRNIIEETCRYLKSLEDKRREEANTCQAKAQFLVQSLQLVESRLVKEYPKDSTNFHVGYMTYAEQEFNGWKVSFGATCFAEGQKACLET